MNISLVIPDHTCSIPLLAETRNYIQQSATPMEPAEFRQWQKMIQDQLDLEACWNDGIH
jgi:hypothetical protein